MFDKKNKVKCVLENLEDDTYDTQLSFWIWSFYIVNIFVAKFSKL
jgi:hypothetical protein